MTFEELQKLGEKDPTAYRQEMRRMRKEEPDRWVAYVEWVRNALNKAPETARARRLSSISALVLGDVRALEQKASGRYAKHRKTGNGGKGTE